MRLCASRHTHRPFANSFRSTGAYDWCTMWCPDKCPLHSWPSSANSHTFQPPRLTPSFQVPRASFVPLKVTRLLDLKSFLGSSSFSHSQIVRLACLTGWKVVTQPHMAQNASVASEPSSNATRSAARASRLSHRIRCEGMNTPWVLSFRSITYFASHHFFVISPGLAWKPICT